MWLTFIINTYANVTGAAEMYKVIMRKVELCTGSTGIDNCDNAVVIGSVYCLVPEKIGL